MQVTFYLTQASANTAAGPFNISGTTSGGAANSVEIQANVSKATLLTGYTEEIANNITGGTVTSTDGTCNTTDTWDINELFVTPTPTPLPTVELQVFGRDENATPENALITFTVNGGSPTTLNNLEPLPASCSLLYTISDLEFGDVVVIESVDSYPMSGADSSTCPTLTGTATSYTHTVGVSSGVDYVALSINSDVNV